MDVASQILDESRSSTGCTHGCSPTTGSGSPTCCASRSRGSRSGQPGPAGGYLALFGALAYARFTTKDVLS